MVPTKHVTVRAATHVPPDAEAAESESSAGSVCESVTPVASVEPVLRTSYVTVIGPPERACDGAVRVVMERSGTGGSDAEPAGGGAAGDEGVTGLAAGGGSDVS